MKIVFVASSGHVRANHVLYYIAHEVRRAGATLSFETRTVEKIEDLSDPADGVLVYLYDEHGKGHYSHRQPQMTQMRGARYAFAIHPRIADYHRCNQRAHAAALQILRFCRPSVS